VLSTNESGFGVEPHGSCEPFGVPKTMDMFAFYMSLLSWWKATLLCALRML
jgi:hypothetical protein